MSILNDIENVLEKSKLSRKFTEANQSFAKKWDAVYAESTKETQLFMDFVNQLEISSTGLLKSVMPSKLNPGMFSKKDKYLNHPKAISWDGFPIQVTMSLSKLKDSQYRSCHQARSYKEDLYVIYIDQNYYYSKEGVLISC